VIEIDGDSHTEQEEYDHLRTKWLEDQGYKVVRFMNSDVHDNLEGIAIQILRICQGEDKL
jgi:very-short-patch-repair endonuclease